MFKLQHIRKYSSLKLQPHSHILSLLCAQNIDPAHRKGALFHHISASSRKQKTVFFIQQILKIQFMKRYTVRRPADLSSVSEKQKHVKRKSVLSSEQLRSRRQVSRRDRHGGSSQVLHY